jgi:hypothetical protein
VGAETGLYCVQWAREDVGGHRVWEGQVPAKKHTAIALTVAQQDLLIEAATGPWCISTFSQGRRGTRRRRGEALALRWQDIVDVRVTIARSLSQIKDVVIFKDTKTEDIRVLALPAEVLVALEAHRKRQDE